MGGKLIFEYELMFKGYLLRVENSKSATKPRNSLFEFITTCGYNPVCHAPTPAVVFQPLVARCGTTERFLFNNTNIRGLRLLQH